MVEKSGSRYYLALGVDGWNSFHLSNYILSQQLEEIMAVDKSWCQGVTNVWYKWYSQTVPVVWKLPDTNYI